MIVITLFKKGKKLDFKKVPDEKQQEEKDKKKGKKSEESDKVAEQIIKSIKRLEDAIKQLNKKPVEYNINVENLNINDPILKELIFNMDKLDIKELSGSLTIGNHFGAVPDKGKPKKEQKKPKSSQVHIKLNQ